MNTNPVGRDLLALGDLVVVDPVGFPSRRSDPHAQRESAWIDEILDRAERIGAEPIGAGVKRPEAVPLPLRKRRHVVLGLAERAPDEAVALLHPLRKGSASAAAACPDAPGSARILRRSRSANHDRGTHRALHDQPLESWAPRWMHRSCHRHTLPWCRRRRGPRQRRRMGTSSPSSRPWRRQRHASR